MRKDKKLLANICIFHIQWYDMAWETRPLYCIILPWLTKRLLVQPKILEIQMQNIEASRSLDDKP